MTDEALYRYFSELQKKLRFHASFITRPCTAGGSLSFDLVESFAGWKKSRGSKDSSVGNIEGYLSAAGGKIERAGRLRQFSFDDAALRAARRHHLLSAVLPALVCDVFDRASAEKV
jgi:hypothetical protein